MNDNTREKAEPIAIIGEACRVPGAGSVGQFWQNLLEGTESVRLATLAEQAAAGVPKYELDDPDFVPVSAVLAEAEYFDPAVFGISATEAELRDPQHRLFLELSYTALDDSGYDPGRYRGDIGVYAASGEDGYQWRNVRRNRKALARSGPLGLATSLQSDYVATFTSYRLGLRGPSLTVHTACSSSLVAVHLACQALHNGECDMALAGGVNLDLPLGRGYVYADGAVYSRDGHCHAFDANSTGTVWSSGGAVVMLKRLSDALADDDCIRSLIIGNAINNDGSTKVGFAAPSQHGQTAAIAQALGLADVDPRSIGFVEAHGTGTVIGDPIEVAALTSAYLRHVEERQWCAIGSVKTNIGHMGSAAGAVGLLKATLAIEHGIVPASLNYENPNPAIDFSASPFFVNTEALRWRTENGAPRRAAVSAFGMGGTNAHVILEQAPPRAAAAAGEGHGGPHVIQLSASTPTALAASAAALADHLDTLPEGSIDLTDVCFTLREGRQQKPERLAVVAADPPAASAALRDHRQWISGSVGRAAPRVVFMFPGQGAQYAGMGAGLYASEHAYRAAIDECCDILDAVGPTDGFGTSLRDSLAKAPARAAEATNRRTDWAQPALFTVEYALAALLRSTGVEPQAMIGHSIGEYVAATCAGVFELADALRIVAARGHLMQSLPGGAMIAVPVAESELRELLPEGASIAAVNGPGACVVSGPDAVMDQLAATLANAEIGVRRLRTSHAFHSPMMDPLLAHFRQVVATAELKAPAIPFASNISGDWITAAEATDPSYWARHVRETVRFGDCVTTVVGDDPGAVLLECGPGRQLSGLAKLRRAAGQKAIHCLPGPGESRQDATTLVAAVAGLWAAGHPPTTAPAGTRGRRVPLPTYPWERRLCWVSPDPDIGDWIGEDMLTDPAAHPVADEWFGVPTWRELPPAGTVAPPSRVLVLADPGDVVAAGLAVRGSAVVRVSRGSRYAPDGAGGYMVRPDSRDDFEALFAKLAERDGIPGHIVHCWTLEVPPADSADAVWAAQDHGFFSVLAMAQALAGTAPESQVHVDVVTAGTHAAIGGDLRMPEHATVTGAVKVLPLEFSWLSIRHIDVDPDFAARAAADGGRLASALIDEVSGLEGRSGASGEALVVMRHGRRWRRHFDNVPQPPAAAGDDLVPFRELGTYLITGGLGGIGITLAEDLARKLRARLVLVSREGLPPRETWGDQANDGISPRAARAIAAIERMERAGAQVLTVAADVTDPGAVCALREEILSRFERLDGIVHSAGVAGGGMAEVKDRGTAEGVLRPKLSGTLALRDAFGEDPLDFVVLCSSVAAIVGGFGQVDYCAANAFLDAHANSGIGWRAPVMSVNWGAWLQVGMAAEAPAPAAFRALQRGPGVLPIRHGLLSERHAPGPDSSTWCSGTVSPDTHWILADHRIGGIPVLPGTGLLEAARCAVAECFPAPGPDNVLELRDVALTELCTVPDGTSTELRVLLVPSPDGVRFEVASVLDGRSRVHARGEAAWYVSGDGQPVSDLEKIAERCSRGTRDAAGMPSPQSGLVVFGPHWRGPVRVLEGDNEVLTLVEAQDGTDADGPWAIHPVLLDEALKSGKPQSQAEYLPFGYGRVIVRKPLPAQAWGHLRYQDFGTAELATADLVMYDDSGAELLRIEDFAMRRVDQSAATDLIGQDLPEQTEDQASPATGIKPCRGSEAVRRVALGALGAQVVVSPTPIGELIAASQKLDYQAVEEGPAMAGDGGPAGQPGYAGAVLPRTERERKVAQVWSELLGRDTIGTDEDFFEIGGNSLIAVQLISFLRKRFGVRLPMRRIFAAPTIAGIAALIDELSPADGRVAAQAGRTASADEG